MAEIVRMPKMSDTMTEGVVAKWHKKVGDQVKTGDLVAEIETDKATMEFESFQEGVLLYRGVEEGKAAPVNGILAILGKTGEDFNALLEEEKKKIAATPKPTPGKPSEDGEKKKTPGPVKIKEVEKSPAPVQQTATPVPSVSGTHIKASPLAKRLAGEKGIDLGTVLGSGDQGRIIKRDIDWFKPGMFVQPGNAQTAVREEGFTTADVSQMRKAIARRLSESKFSAPHFYLTMEIDMDAVVSARESINAVTGSKISFNDLIIKATASALREHPRVNASWMGETIRYYQHIHIGVAIAVDEGLVVPVVRFADTKTLREINAEVREYSGKAKDKKLQPSDWEGNTFTISNLGMYGIDEFTAIINPPDACILAVGAIHQKPVVKNGIVVPCHVMKVTLSCDHRIVDGVTGSEFLKTLKALLENPVILL
ncbi:MAG: pyruvate dehydrogenase complex dihydrolipoamide acetyltransferase, partial [Bacteroidia bacterium]|nr:pyruvate dehydrogenase complex dihydrolipoamide acetyltransferase [Bacteroidia bacterium]